MDQVNRHVGREPTRARAAQRDVSPVANCSVLGEFAKERNSELRKKHGEEYFRNVISNYNRLNNNEQ